MHPPRPHSNLAARMGRWSAAHWKTATFGWLAFVIVAFGLGRRSASTTSIPNAPGPGESGRMDRILDDGFKQPADESVLIQSRSARAGTPAFDGRGRRRRRARLPRRRRAGRPSRRGRKGRPRRARRLHDQRRQGQGGRQDPAGPRRGRRRAAAHPGFTIGEFGDASAQKGVETAYGNDLGKAGALSLPITLLILVARVRRARGGRHPAAARADRRPRDVRPDRAAEPPDPGRLRGAGDGAADRARRRRRLLDVLPEARARRSGPPDGAPRPRSRPPRRPPAARC